MLPRRVGACWLEGLGIDLQTVAVVSHWVFLKHLFAPYSHHVKFREPFGNCEMRFAALVPASHPEQQHMKEHDEL